MIDFMSMLEEASKGDDEAEIGFLTDRASHPFIAILTDDENGKRAYGFATERELKAFMLGAEAASDYLAETLQVARMEDLRFTETELLWLTRGEFDYLTHEVV